MMEGKFLPLFIITISLWSSLAIQPPAWDYINRIVTFPEDTKVGSLLGTIIATGRNSVPVEIKISDAATAEKISFNFTQTGDKAFGNIYLKEKMDRDRGISEWKLHFKAFDSKIREDQVPEYTFTIIITDVNDNEPHFKSPFYTVEVFENDMIGKSVITVTATDPDNGAGGVIFYQMKPSGQASDLYHNAFKMESVTSGSETVGRITLNGTLDFAELSFYQYLLIATDKDPNHPLSGNATLVIKVVDIQNTPPYFQRLPYVASINENAKIPTELSISALAFDGDTGIPNKIAYFFPNSSEPCRDLFKVDQNSGQITTKGNLDRDGSPLNRTEGICQLTLQALELNTSKTEQHGNDSTETTVVITINDVNDNGPVFLFSSYEANIVENISGIPLNITSPGDIFVHDIDQSGNNKFRLEILTHDGSISQDIKPVPEELSGGGNILLQLNRNFKFDYEKQHNATYILRASDTKSPYATSECTIFIEIIDFNDNDPIFQQNSYTAYALENQTDSNSILNVTATDKDSGLFGIITYFLSGDEHFTVNSSTGEIKTAKPWDIDREKRDTYYLTLVATDGGGRRNAVGIEIKILDINDNAPIFLLSAYKYAVVENEKTFPKNIIISASDADQSNLTNSKIIYRLASPSNMCGSFSINNSTGEIKLERPIDYEALDDPNSGIIHLVVIASDKGSPSLSSIVSVDIKVEKILLLETVTIQLPVRKLKELCVAPTTRP